MLALLTMTACLLGPGGVLESASRASGLEITLRMPKTRYLRGEPIAIEITLANTSDQDAFFGAESLPLRDMDYRLTLRFYVSKTKLEIPRFLPDLDGYKPRSRSLKRGAKVMDVIFLQHFMSGFEVAEYRIPVAFDRRASIGGKHVCMYGATILTFKVVTDDRKERNKILSSYLEMYRSALTPNEEYRAAQALAMMQDADSLPYLVRALIHQRKHNDKFLRFQRDPISDRLIESLASNKAAIAIVNETLDSKEPAMTAQEVLTVAAIWKYRLPNDRIKELQKRKDPALQKQLREYIEQMKKLYKDTD